MLCLSTILISSLFLPHSKIESECFPANHTDDPSSGEHLPDLSDKNMILRKGDDVLDHTDLPTVAVGDSVKYKCDTDFFRANSDTKDALWTVALSCENNGGEFSFFDKAQLDGEECVASKTCPTASVTAPDSEDMETDFDSATEYKNDDSFRLANSSTRSIIARRALLIF